MIERPTPEEVAAETNWLARAAKIRGALEKAGCRISYSDAYIAKVAEIVGKSAESFRPDLTAEGFLRNYAPEVHAMVPAHISMTSVLLLAQIHAISPSDCEKIAPRVFNGDATRAEVRAVFDATKEKCGAQGGVGHERWHRDNGFSRLVKRFLEGNLSMFGDWEDPTVRPCRKQQTVPCDLELWSGRQQRVAVEVKGYRQKITHRYQVELLGVASLLLREFSEVLIIAPDEWARSMPEVANVRNKLRLKSVRLATLDVDLALEEPRRALTFW